MTTRNAVSSRMLRRRNSPGHTNSNSNSNNANTGGLLDVNNERRMMPAWTRSSSSCETVELVAAAAAAADQEDDSDDVVMLELQNVTDDDDDDDGCDDNDRFATISSSESESSLCTVDDIRKQQQQDDNDDCNNKEEDSLILVTSSSSSSTSNNDRSSYFSEPQRWRNRFSRQRGSKNKSTTKQLKQQHDNSDNNDNNNHCLDVEMYMAKREMTKTQERWNAVSVLPSPLYCLYFLCTAQWLTAAAIEEARTANGDVSYETTAIISDGGFMAWANAAVGDEHCCLADASWHSMRALPPLPVLAVAVGILLHAPFSFLYHWTYAHKLGATARTQHWSRRMDQCMIHVASTFMVYAVSGSWDYAGANVLYNTDCCFRQFRPTVRPLRNQIRIFISILAYTLPLAQRGEFGAFLQLWAVLAVSGWFFAQYPIGGWSHTVFHFVIALVPPLLMGTAVQLAASAPQIKIAAQCALLHHV